MACERCRYILQFHDKHSIFNPAEVRWARPEELAGLMAVELAADELFEQVGIVFPPGTTMIEEADDPRRVLVGGSPPVGFALFGWIDGRSHLDQLAVHPYHGCGRGSAGGSSQAVLRPRGAQRRAAVTLTTYRDVPWNAPWYARTASPCWTRRGVGARAGGRWCEHERELGIEVAPRVVMVCPS